MFTHEPETYPAKHYNSQMLVMLLCEFCYTQLYATRGRTSTPTIVDDCLHSPTETSASAW